MTIDQLIVKLVLDAAGFTQGQKDAIASTQKMADDVTKSATKAEKAQTDSHTKVRKSAEGMAAGIADANKSAAESFETILRKAMTLFAVFTGTRSIIGFMEQIIALDAAVGRLGHNVGSTPERVSAIGRAVERAGGSFEGAASGIQAFSDAFQELRTNGDTALMKPIAQLQQLGGHPIQIGRDWHKTILQIGDDLHALDARDPALADFLGRQILHDPSLVNWAKRGSAAMLADEAKVPKISDDDTRAAYQYQQTWADLHQSIQDVAQVLVTDFGPAITGAINYIKDWIAANKPLIEQKVKEWIKDITDWLHDHQQDIKDFGAGLLALVKVAGEIAVAFGRQSPMMQALEAFAVLLGGRVLGALSLALASLRLLGTMPVTGALGLILGGGAAAGAMNSPHTDDYGRDAGTWGGDAPAPDHAGTVEDPSAHTRHRQTRNPPSPAGRVWNAVKQAVGFGDNAPGAGVAGVGVGTKLRDLDAKQRDDFIAALAKTEGNPGARPDYNNPGNIKWGVWARMHGAAEGGIAGIAKFPTAETGRNAAEALLFGRSYRDLTISQAMNKYSPRGDGANDPDAKARTIAAGIGAPSPASRSPVQGAQPPLPVAQAAPGSTGSGDPIATAESHLHENEAQARAALGSKMSPGEWCADFVNGVLKQSGGEGINGSLARTFAGWGKAVAQNDIQRNDVLVVNGGHHVGIATGRRDQGGNVEMIAGNTRDGRGGHDVERYFVNPNNVYAARRGEVQQVQAAPVAKPITADKSARLRPIIVANRSSREDDPFAASPTVNDAANSLLRAYRESAHRGPSGPIKVELTDANASKVGDTFGRAMLGRRAAGATEARHASWMHSSAWEGLGESHRHITSIASNAAAARFTAHHGPVNSNNRNSSSETHVGEVHVHTQAQDAAGIAADIRPALERGQAAARGNYGMA